MELNEEKELTIKEFFELSENEKGEYLIDTPDGWQKIGFLVKKNNKECYNLVTEDGIDLGCSNDHLVFTNSGWKKSEDIDVQNDLIETKNGFKEIVAKEYIGVEDTYDLEVLSDSHKYYSNGIVSHNTGKSLLCKILCKELNTTILYVLPSHIKSLESVSKLCEMAKDLSPALMIIEDIDYIAEDREDLNSNWLVIELMNRMDGIVDFGDVVTLATTNLIDKVEKAIKNRPGRFDRVITINPPNEICREKMLKLFSKNFILEDVDFNKIVEKTDKMSGAYIKEVCKTAAMIAIQTGSINENQMAIVKHKHFTDALKEIKNKDYTAIVEPKKFVGFGSD